MIIVVIAACGLLLLLQILCYSLPKKRCAANILTPQKFLESAQSLDKKVFSGFNFDLCLICGRLSMFEDPSHYHLKIPMPTPPPSFDTYPGYKPFEEWSEESQAVIKRYLRIFADRC